MAHMTERKCQWCKGPFMARTADVNRGWAKFCSKSCKAMRQEKRTGQYHARQCDEQPLFGGGTEFSNAHQFSNEEHDCNKD